MTTGWAAVLVAGFLEVAWAHSIRLTGGFTKVIPSLVCVALTAAVIVALNIAMQHLPVGTVYAVFVGIGAVGALGDGDRRGRPSRWRPDRARSPGRGKRTWHIVRLRRRRCGTGRLRACQPPVESLSWCSAVGKLFRGVRRG